MDIVGTNRGDNFIYSITTFAGDGGVSSGSQPVNTSLPVIINPTWIGKTILLQEPGSFIAHSGAMLTVNGNAAFPLELDESMHLFRVPKNEPGSNDRKIKRTIKLNREVFLTVTNPDGTTSVAKMFTRRE